MNHQMKLFSEPFELIQCGGKIIEIRLNDEKRQKVKIGDTITFSKLPKLEETLTVKVVGLLQYVTFEQLYTDIPFEYFGCEGRTMEWMLEGTYEIYSKEQEAKYGALGIRIELMR